MEEEVALGNSTSANTDSINIRDSTDTVTSPRIRQTQTSAYTQSLTDGDYESLSHSVGTAKAARMSKRYKEARRQITREVSQMRLSSKKPWLDAKGRQVWSSSRVAVGKFILSPWTDMTLSIIIIFNLVLILLETEWEAKCYPKYKDNLDECPTASSKYRWLQTANVILLIIYTFEAALSIYALRIQYFKQLMKWFDFIICVAGWMSIIFGNLFNISWFRILRVGRILKAIRFLDNIPELWMLMAGFLGSMKAMFFGSLILLFLLGFFSIIIVQFVHPINASIYYANCPACSSGFGSMGDSMLTLFQQIVAGDSWGEISVPVVKEDSIGLLLVFTQIVISIGAMNLILGVIVDRAVDARERGKVHRMKEIANEQKERKLQLLNMLREMDIDGDGTVDRREVLQAAESSVDFASRLNLVGVTPLELEEMCDCLEDKVTGEIGYVHFCNALHQVEAADVRKTAVLMKMGFMSMKESLVERLDRQDASLAELQYQIAHLSQAPGLRQVVQRATRPTILAPDLKKLKPKKDALIHSEVSLSAKELSFDIGDDEPSTQQIASHTYCNFIADQNLHSHTSQPFKDDVRQYEAQLASEASRLQLNLSELDMRLRQNLSEMDICWNKALQIAAHASSLTEAKESAAVQTKHRNGSTRHTSVVDPLEKMHSVSKRLQCLADVFEDEVATLLRDCKTSAPVEREDAFESDNRGGDVVVPI